MRCVCSTTSRRMSNFLIICKTDLLLDSTFGACIPIFTRVHIAVLLKYVAVKFITL